MRLSMIRAESCGRKRVDSNISVPMVDWHTRAFLAHREADILGARQGFLDELDSMRQTIDAATSPSEARTAN